MIMAVAMKPKITITTVAAIAAATVAQAMDLAATGFGGSSS